jgi:hypothetical protein
VQLGLGTPIADHSRPTPFPYGVEGRKRQKVKEDGEDGEGQKGKKVGTEKVGTGQVNLSYSILI